MSEPQGKDELPAQHPEDTATPTEAKDGDNATMKPDPSLCGICEVNPPKYKCPRCRLP
jgi:hypothetical protein